MWFLATFETEWIPAFAIHLHDTAILINHTIVTPGKWTPPNLLVIVSVWFAEPFLICFEVCACKIFSKHRVRDSHVALMLGACRWNTELESLVNSCAQIILPIGAAELMAALERVSLGSGSVKLRVAYLAVTLVLGFQCCIHIWEALCNGCVEFKSLLYQKLLMIFCSEPGLLELFSIPLVCP
jgi:hypothetical protein